jgi:hypothetical protein
MDSFKDALPQGTEEKEATMKLQAEASQLSGQQAGQQAGQQQCVRENYQTVVGGRGGGPDLIVCHPIDELQRYFHPQPEIKLAPPGRGL